jgi:DNA (cytosine-5)-methyltransferase 1
MRVLDLFCGAGGCSVGYQQGFADAGLEVEIVGVDLSPQPNYPYEFVQADAMTFPLDGFDFIHASPPCQAYTTMSNRWRGKGGKADSHADLIGGTRVRLSAAGVPWVIENVPGARSMMRDVVTLTGGMFGLGVHRPRLFESSELILMPPKAAPPAGAVGVYGVLDGRRLFTRADGSEQRAARTLEQARDAMGIDWMEWDGLRESVPPAYTRYIARQIAPSLSRKAAA